MAKKYEIKHRGLSLWVRELTAFKSGVKYTSHEIRDYSSGKLVRHHRSTRAEARAKAKEILECRANGKLEILGWSDELRGDIEKALKALEPVHVRIDRACSLIADAVKLVPEDEILAACRVWRESRPNRKLTQKKVSDVILEFLSRREEKVSERRFRADECYLGAFETQFSTRHLHEISTLDIKDWADAKGWGAKTKNDALGLVRQLYCDAIERNYVAENPAKIKREALGGSDVEIFTPDEVRRILLSVEDRLKPFFALIFFSGLRKEEASRLSVSQVREGLKCGVMFFPASLAKTNRSRSISFCENLRAWLMRFLPNDGPLLPVEWQGIRRLDELPAYAVRRSGVKWVRNGPRHSFATYFLRLSGDPAETVKQMGNSLAQLDRHYNSRADSVTPETAERYFAIFPPTNAENLIPMPEPDAAAEPGSTATAVG